MPRCLAVPPPEADVAFHSTTNNPVGFLLWRLVHRCISIFLPQR